MKHIYRCNNIFHGITLTFIELKTGCMIDIWTHYSKVVRMMRPEHQQARTLFIPIQTLDPPTVPLLPIHAIPLVNERIDDGPSRIQVYLRDCDMSKIDRYQRTSVLP